MQVIGAALSPHGGDNPGGARPTHSPTVFIRDLGAAYRASGRTTPIMDVFAHPSVRRQLEPVADRRARVDDDRARRLRQARHAARRRRSTERRSPARRCRSSTTSTASSRGSRRRRPRRSTPAASRRRPSPSTRRRRPRTTRSRSQTAFCQPNVVGILLFHAFDESDLDRWQSGLYYANLTPKSSLPAVRDAAQQVRRGVAARCDGLQLTPQLRYLYWPRGQAPPAGTRARRVHVRHRLRTTSRRSRRRRSRGDAVGRERTDVEFPNLVRKGTYRIRLTLSAPVNPGLPLAVASNPLTISRQVSIRVSPGRSSGHSRLTCPRREGSGGTSLVCACVLVALAARGNSAGKLVDVHRRGRERPADVGSRSRRRRRSTSRGSRASTRCA